MFDSEKDHAKFFNNNNCIIEDPFPFQPDEPEWSHVENHTTIRYLSFIGVLGTRFVYSKGKSKYETVAMSAEAYEAWFEVVFLHRERLARRKTLV